MLFQVPEDVSLEEENPAAGQTPWKGSGLLSGHGVQLASKALFGCPFLVCMHHSAVSAMSLDLESKLDSMVTFGLGTEVWTMRKWCSGRMNIRVLNMVLVLTIDAL